MAAFGDRIQALMDEVYSEWQKEENKSKGKWDILNGFSEAHQIAVVFGNFNYQVENGGIEQWIYNGYFHEDAEKLAEYLETGAKLDERCQAILDSVYTLEQHARETDSDRDGNYFTPYDEDGERRFIGDMIDCDAFDSWYYEHCGKDDWWETVCGVIDKTEREDDRLLAIGDCAPGGMDADIKGKVVAIKPEVLLPKYQTRSHQLILAIGGFGCSPNARGRAVFGTNIYTGEQARWERSDILGVIDEDALSKWERNKLFKLHEPAKKESVVARIREVKAAPPEERKTKPHNKTGPEL
ncbi:MAG: DMP19 family protein [Christensenellaceae bacterium]|jgi:hypothetical protein